MLNSGANTGECHICCRGSVVRRERGAIENGRYDHKEGKGTKECRSDRYC